MNKNLILKSIIFIAMYIVATIAISYFRDGEELMEILTDRWYEYVLLFPVIIGFNYFFDKKNKKASKNKFYKDL
jgi:hypothetical protein